LIRFEHFQNGKGIKRIVRELGIARDTVRKVLRSGATEFIYKRTVQPQPKLGVWVSALTEILEGEAKLPKRERRSTQRLFEELRGRGYDGAHDSVHRFVKAWREGRSREPMRAFIPLRFDPGEAYQFDWSHEAIEFAGVPLTVKVAQMRLAYSRMPFVRAYFRETQEMCSTMVEPVACTPAAGWEKSQVENQVGTMRDLLFRPKPKVKTLDELNGWLAQCIAYAKRTRHPEPREHTVWEVFEEERASLTQFVGSCAQ
jgi:transposase